jgi:hypothetical protein
LLDDIADFIAVREPFRVPPTEVFDSNPRPLVIGRAEKFNVDAPKGGYLMYVHGVMIDDAKIREC